MHTPTVYITVLSRIQLSHQTIQKFSATHLKMYFAIQKFIFAQFFHFYEIAIHKSLLFMNFLMVFIFVHQIDRCINLRSSKFNHYHHQIIVKLIRLVLSKFIHPKSGCAPVMSHIIDMERLPSLVPAKTSTLPPSPLCRVQQSSDYTAGVHTNTHTSRHRLYCIDSYNGVQ